MDEAMQTINATFGQDARFDSVRVLFKGHSTHRDSEQWHRAQRESERMRAHLATVRQRWPRFDVHFLDTFPIAAAFADQAVRDGCGCHFFREDADRRHVHGAVNDMLATAVLGNAICEDNLVY